MADASINTGFPLFHRVERRAIRPSPPPVIALTVDGNRELHFLCKRYLDVLFSVIALLVLLPLMVVIAFAIATATPFFARMLRTCAFCLGFSCRM